MATAMTTTKIINCEFLQATAAVGIVLACLLLFLLLYFSLVFLYCCLLLDLYSVCVLTAGHFGCVFRGLLKVPEQKAELEVAVKTLRSFTGSANLSPPRNSAYHNRNNLLVPSK